MIICVINHLCFSHFTDNLQTNVLFSYLLGKLVFLVYFFFFNLEFRVGCMNIFVSMMLPPPLGVPDVCAVENAAVYLAKRTIQHL